jgi:hypothetical protein
MSGRPTAITESVVRKLEQAFRHDFTVEEACRTSGIARSTYYSHLKANEDFSDKMARSQAYLVIKARDTICKAIKDGNLRTAKWYLERKHPEEFSLRHMSKRPPTVVEDFDKYTIEQLTKISQTG